MENTTADKLTDKQALLNTTNSSIPEADSREFIKSHEFDVSREPLEMPVLEQDYHDQHTLPFGNR